MNIFQKAVIIKMVYYRVESEGFSVKSMRRLLSLVLMIMLMLPLVPVPASAAYGVLFIPESAYDLELPDQNNAGPGLVKLNFDPFLGQMEGSRSWVHWDTSTILTECGGFMDLTYVCAVESEYPEGNYIVRCVAFYRNDAEKSLVSYHITYQTDETEYYVISYFGHHYREAMLAMTRAQLTKAETEKAQKEGKTTAQALQDKVVNLYNGTYDGTDTKIPDSKHKQVEIYKYDSDKKEYLEIKHDSSGNLPKDLTDPKVLKYYKTASWFTPTPDTIYAGTYMNGDILLRNGSGKYLGTASWFEWDYDSGKVTMSKLDNLRRLYSFPSPRVRVRAEALDEGPVASEEEFYDGMDVVPETDAVDIIPEDATDGLRFSDLVFFQPRWTGPFMAGYSTASEIAMDPDGRALLAALMTVEFTDQVQDAEVDTEKPIYVGAMEDMTVVAFDTNKGYARIFLQLDPLATSYGYIQTHDAEAVRTDMESICDQVWDLNEDAYYDALIALAEELAE